MLYNSYSLVLEWVLSFMSSIPESSVAHFIGPPPEVLRSLSGQSVSTNTCRSSFKKFPSQSQFNGKNYQTFGRNLNETIRSGWIFF